MILDELAELTRKRIAAAKEELSPEKAHAIAAGIAELEKGNGGFTFPFEQALKKPGLSVISEVKKASPSKGVIAENFPYLDTAVLRSRTDLREATFTLRRSRMR